ncbi:hypothetical protein MHB50_06170 [Siminovitchia sp. FSL H7-0308]|uniref:Uncharacterized protein n=1 Tax=Siminovitchia thermophila TaxID=1245522 RepID=A0ABS2RD78_9BACI|nr:hypothetical protein [Siminovitchia thermophila]MBM7717603.1 hypothetical protein [Siminovitchia thermophila]ONK21092.1 hypothetical protein BLX87_23565 [Bacillus sp. VT-16-64]
MESAYKILNAVKYIGSTILLLGMGIFLYGFFVSDTSAMIGIGIGTVMGAIFIFLIGVFFVATEEMESKTDKGVRLSPKQKERPVDTPFETGFTYPRSILTMYRRS